MQVILVCQKAEFDDAHLKEVQKHVPVTWVDSDKTDIINIPELSDNEEKVLALSPVPIDWQLPDDFYGKVKSLRYICVPTTSCEFLDLKKCKQLGIKVTNVPHYATEAVAEQAVMMLLALSKRLPEQIKTSFQYEFSDNIKGDDLVDKQVGIIGLGDIGTRLAEMLSGMGMRVAYWSARSRNGKYKHYDSMEKLMTESDVIIPLFSSNDETKGLLDEKKLASLKDTAYFIGLIDEACWDKSYLLGRIQQGKLAGLTFESEKEQTQNYKGNVFAVPPFAWYSEQSLAENIEVWADNIISCIQGKPKNIVV